MTDDLVTVDLRLPKNLIVSLTGIASIASVSIETVVAVIFALSIYNGTDTKAGAKDDTSIST